MCFVIVLDKEDKLYNNSLELDNIKTEIQTLCTELPLVLTLTEFF